MKQMGRHMQKPRKDPVKTWFFIVLGALFVATAGYVWVVTSGYHL